jgi:geranylgeranyl diphosphate synthase type II
MAKCDDSYLRPVLDLFTETALEIGEGQQYDIDFETRNDVSEDEYIEMIRLKTSVLLACALKIGAILADAPEPDQKNLYLFGERLGLAFQLQDDYLDVYGNPDIFGKRIGGDIFSNKKTYMLINALNRANSEQRKELDHWIQVKETDRTEKVEAVTRLYNEIGIDQLALKKIDYYFEDSKQYLDAVNLPDSRKQILANYAQRLMHRNY